MKTKLSVIVTSYINHRAFALDNRIAMADMKKLNAITKIKNHMAYVKHSTETHQKNVVKILIPELEIILPGKSSKYYECMCDKLNQIKSIVNG